MDDKQLIVLVDFSALFRRAWHVSAEMSVAFESTVSGVNRASKEPNSLVAICCDGKGNWRKEIFPEYKAHRDKPDNNMYGEMDRTLERLRKDGNLIWKCDGFEADDVIATATHAALDRGHCVRIVSSDKDLMQLLNIKVEFQAIHAEGWPIVGPEKVREKFGVEPEQLGDWLALVGDTSDNIKGCPGIGAKTATEILNKVQSLQGIWYAIDPPPGTEPIEIGTMNIVKKLRENALNIEKARKLVGLRIDAPINFDEIYNERKQEDLITDYMIEMMDKHSETTDKAPDVADTGSAITESYPEQPEQAPSIAAVATSVAPSVEKEAGVALSPYDPYGYSFDRQLEPRSFRDTVICARELFNARLYQKYKNPHAMVAAILRGREMGYGAATSLDIFHVIEEMGNLTLALHAHVIIDRAINHPDCEYFMFVEGNEKFATYIAKHRRNPKPQSLTFTIEEAQAAELVKPTKSGKPNNWMKRPATQLRKTCGVQLARIVFPGAAMGLYCTEELGVDE